MLTTFFAAGLVQTEMGNGFGEAHGFGEAAITAVESASGMIEQVLKANLETTGGKFIDYKGDGLPW
jgi:hypothetical protein